MQGRLGRRALYYGVSFLLGTPALAGATSVAGEVYDVRTGTVVPGARVTLGGEAATAGADGIYKLIAAPRKPADIIATAPGYAVTVIKYFPPAPVPPEVWRNVPLMPTASKTPHAGDFVEFFFRNAPLEEDYKGHVAARRFDALPLQVGIRGADPAGAEDVALALDRLNERWGLSILEAAEGEEPSVILDFGADGADVQLGYRDGCPAASFPGGATAEYIDMAEAYMRRLVLNGECEGVRVTPEELRGDKAVAEDLDAVVEIIYREPADFNYAVFKRRRPAKFSILTDLYLGVGGYRRDGVTDENGRAVEFPGDYQLGQLAVAGGGTYRGVWAKAGFWFAGIWEPDAEKIYPWDGAPAEKVLRRNFSTYYRAGYWLEPRGGVRVTPLAGYRTLSVRGKYKSPGTPAAINTPLDVDYTTRYDGFEAGLSGDVGFGWYDLGLFGEYARVFADEPWNLAEFGFGASPRIGVGTFAFVRFYWGRPLRYTFAGLAMKLAIPL